MLNRLRALLASQCFIAAGGIALFGLLFGTLLGLRDLKTYVVETIATGLAAGLVYLILLYLLEHSAEQQEALWLLLAGAVLFRLLLFPLPPALSEDVHRYQWDAHVQQAGVNPYLYRPDDPAVAALAAEFRARGQAIPGSDIPTIYPPLAELTYVAAGITAGAFSGTTELLFYKLPFVAADLLTVFLLAWWIRRTGGRNFQLAVYAWNPLVIVEFAASGHNDSLAIAAVLTATIVIIRGRWAVSTSLLTAGTLVKFFPTVLLPLWLRRMDWPRSGRAWRAILAAAAVAVICAWPYRAAWPEILDSLAYYESRWHHNNASLYAALSWFAEPAAPQDPQVAIPPGATFHDFAGGLGMGIVAGVALWAAARKLDLLRAAYLLFGAALLLAPNAFPWYFTWMVPLLVFFPHPAWLLLTVLQFLSYHVLIDYQAAGTWFFRPEMLWLTYGPFYAWLVAASLLGGRSASARR